MAIDKIVIQYEAEVAEFKRELDEIKKQLKGVESTAADSAKKTGKALDDSGTSANKFKDTLKDVGKSIAAAFAVQQIVNFGREAVKAASAFEKSMGNVATLVDTNVESIDAMGQSVRQIAARTPVELGQLSSALYDVRSAGVSAEDAMAVLESSAQLGVAGLSTTAEAANIMTSAVNAFAAEGLSAEQISDILFKTVKAGKTTLAELTSQFGGVAPAAAAAGVSLADLQASTAAITTLGTPAAQAQTQLKQALTEMQKPGKELSKIFNQLGAKDGLDLIKTSGGLGNAFKLIKEQAEASGMTVSQVTGSVETATAILALGGTVNEAYTTTLADMTTGANAVNVAFEKQAQTADAQFQLMQNAFEDVKIEIGNALMPVLLDAAEGLRDFMEGVDADTIRNLGKALAIAAAGFAGFKFGQLVKGLAATVQGMKGATMSVQGLSKAVAANPFGLIATAVATLVAYGPDIIDMFSGVTELQKDMAEASEKATENLRKEQAELNLVADALSRTNPGSEQRAKLIQRFNELSPTAIKDLKDEAKFNEQLNSALKKANESFALRIKLRGAEAAASVASQKQIDVQAKIIEAEQKLLMEGFTEAQIKARQGSGALSRFTQLALTLGGQGAAAAAMNEFTELIRLDEEFNEASKSLEIYTKLATDAKNVAENSAVAIGEQAAATNDDTTKTKDNTTAKEIAKTAVEKLKEQLNLLKTAQENAIADGDIEKAKEYQTAISKLENQFKIFELRLKEIQGVADESEGLIFEWADADRLAEEFLGLKEDLGTFTDEEPIELPVILTIKEKAKKEALEKVEKLQGEIANIANAANSVIGPAMDALNGYFDLQLNNLEKEKNQRLANENLTAEERLRIEEEYEAKKNEIMAEQFEVSRGSQIIQATMAAAQAALNAFTSTALIFAPAAPAAAAAAAAFGALQIGIIAAQPNPYKFYDGTPYLQLGDNPKGRDTIPVMAHEGEAIIPTRNNLQYPGLAKSWIEGDLDRYINNNFVRPALMEQQKQAEEEFADRLAASMALQMAANFDDYRLHRDLKEQTAVLRDGFHSMKTTRKKLRGA